MDDGRGTAEPKYDMSEGLGSAEGDGYPADDD